MKAGTAQKLALNMLSTAVMSARGLVVDGLMVAMRPTNAKLRARAVLIVGRILQAAPGRAEALLADAGWDLPAALISGRWGVKPEAARAHLSAMAGSVAKALEEKPAPG
jgi:N-acetylmuramic acid 6-phosphate etherase